MAARLKVFVTSDGLTDHVVAASSRPKALAAWGAHQDLFKTGGARETTDPELVKAALARPGEVLRRAADTPDIPQPTPRPPKPKGPSKADLARIARAKMRLADLRAAHDRALAGFEAARAGLEAQARAEAARFDIDLAKAEAALAKAREMLDA